jgi:hypothetical protein
MFNWAIDIEDYRTAFTAGNRNVPTFGFILFWVVEHVCYILNSRGNLRRRLRSSKQQEKCHSRESGNPIFALIKLSYRIESEEKWIPAFGLVEKPC